MVRFTDLQLSQSIIKAVTNMGFVELTPIQEKAIPLAMEGKDLIGHARTGTGKTAAFGIPMIEAIRPTSKTVQGLVVTPTRELALQVSDELNRIGQIRGVRTAPLYGGQDFGAQLRALECLPQIIVGTPGRLLEHLRRQTLRPNDIRFAVLDEADKMLDMGFIEDIEKILKRLTPDRCQTLLFSATISPAVQQLAQAYLKDPVLVELEEISAPAPVIEQTCLKVPERQKVEVLTHLLDRDRPEQAIVFAATKVRVDELSKALEKQGYPAAGIHGDLLQTRRESILGQFRDGKIRILVATDVAARGLDIQGVTHVYNFDVPQDPESYVHRVGRTGRAGKTGVATTLVTPKEAGLLYAIEQAINQKIPEAPLPGGAEAAAKKLLAAADKVRAEIGTTDVSFYGSYAESLLADSDPVAVVATALKLLSKQEEKPPVRLTEVPQLVTPELKAEKAGGSKGSGHGKPAGRAQGHGHRDTGARGKAGDQRPGGKGAPKGKPFKQFMKKQGGGAPGRRK